MRYCSRALWGGLVAALLLPNTALADATILQGERGASLFPGASMVSLVSLNALNKTRANAQRSSIDLDQSLSTGDVVATYDTSDPVDNLPVSNGIIVIVIERTTHQRVVLAAGAGKPTFATTASGITKLKEALAEVAAKQSPSNYWVILATQGNIQPILADSTIVSQLTDLGASDALLAIDDNTILENTSFIMAGYKGMGTGNAALLLNTAGHVSGVIALIDDAVIGMQTLPALTIGSADIVAGSVTSDAIASNAVTSTKIAVGAVQSSHIYPNEVDAGDILDNTVTTADILNNAVTSAKISDGNVTTDKIAANAINTMSITGPAVLFQRVMTPIWLRDNAAPVLSVNPPVTFLETFDSDGINLTAARSGWVPYIATSDQNALAFGIDTGSGGGTATAQNRRLFAVQLIPSGVLNSTADACLVRILVSYSDDSANGTATLRPRPRVGIYGLDSSASQAPRFVGIWRSGPNASDTGAVPTTGSGATLAATGPGLRGLLGSYSFTSDANPETVSTATQTFAASPSPSLVPAFSELLNSTTNGTTLPARISSGEIEITLSLSAGYTVRFGGDATTDKVMRTVYGVLRASDVSVVPQGGTIVTDLDPSRGLSLMVVGGAATEVYKFYRFDVTVIRQSALISQ